jgi:hypothetical protein
MLRAEASAACLHAHYTRRSAHSSVWVRGASDRVVSAVWRPGRGPAARRSARRQRPGAQSSCCLLTQARQPESTVVTKTGREGLGRGLASKWSGCRDLGRVARGRGALISTGVAGRGALVSDPANPGELQPSHVTRRAPANLSIRASDRARHLMLKSARVCFILWQCVRAVLPPSYIYIYTLVLPCCHRIYWMRLVPGWDLSDRIRFTFKSAVLTRHPAQSPT